MILFKKCDVVSVKQYDDIKMTIQIYIMKVVKYHVSSNIMLVIKDVRLRNGISLSLCKKNKIW